MKNFYYILLLLIIVSRIYAYELINVDEIYSYQFAAGEVPAAAVFIKDSLFVLEAKKGEIFKINIKKGEVNRKFKLEDSVGAVGITYFDNKFFVPIPNKNKICVYNKNFKKMYEIKVKDPTDIEFYKNTYIVVSNDGHKILRFNSKTLDFIDEVGVMGFYEREFRYPFDLLIDKNGDIYVSEVINTRVQVLNNKFKFVKYIGKWGVSSGRFYRPKGIAFYKNYLLVADGFLGVIQLFDKKTGDLKYLLGKKGQLIKFKSPVRIRIYKDYLSVIDYFTKKLYVFRF
ncbi:conserved hypothetical protein [Deferribacter desulfuricans SSM1]|uniref:NHL repeat containing protein n=1 Tax=Deferribacter desulfuricans (strain DSM 14783 / JCM 11476 / NBRC 101012 / SSM1) TaxID=639282 RepID=D3PCA1_DEFDS|nr:hypothetical protein [Deferribacter desulfuricans]BAI80224.1 conserved hypothetical protein [Deferribacter desulfuricans SSM1]